MADVLQAIKDLVHISIQLPQWLRRKRNLIWVALGAIVLALCIVHESSFNPIQYEIEGGEAVVKGLKSTVKGKLKIPSTAQIDGTTYPVKSIGQHAFWMCDHIIVVVIPESVTYIGEEAFRNCGALKEVAIENPDCEIADNAFLNCHPSLKIIRK